ncbi:MAG: FMN-binding domain protein [Thermoleophilia bacterium]|nr:FMN-binding domain protein [Thermoleophilia bacterium]
MKPSPSRSLRRTLLRPAPYVLSATIVGTVALVNFHPQASQSTFDISDTKLAKVNPDGSPTAATSPVTTNEQMAERRKGEVPFIPGPARTVVGSYTDIWPEHPFGKIQVAVTVESGRIIDAKVVRLKTYDGRSEQIANFSVPVLIQDTLVSGTTDYDHVSSATYTSKAYHKSLQAAIVKLTSTPPADAPAAANDPLPGLS